MVLMGTVIGAVGVFQYQQVAQLAREASRYASVHGNYYYSQYSSSTASAAQSGAAADIKTNAINPYSSGLSSSKLTSTITWSNTLPAGFVPATASSANKVTVTISYQWMSLLYFGSPTFSSTSVAVITN
jgi:hypothetical protein